MSKQVDVSQSRLSRELDKIDGVVKSEIRMLKADRQRFQMKHKNLKPPRISPDARADAGTSSKAKRYRRIDEEDEVEPRPCRASISQEADERTYATVRSWLLTDNQLDLDKFVCLHLLTAHVDGFDECTANLPDSNYVTSRQELLNLINKEKNNAPGKSEEEDRLFEFPCYILKIQHDETKCCCNKKLLLNPEDKALKEFELRYHQFVEKNKEFSRVLQTERIKGPNILGKMPIVSPNLYNRLLENPDQNNDQTPSTIKASLSSYNNLNHSENFDKLITGDYYKPDTTFLREMETQALAKKTIKKYIYVRPSLELSEIFDDKYKYRISTICVNHEFKKLVKMILEVLIKINTQKANLFLKTISDPEIINIVLKKPAVNMFIKSLINSSIFSSKSNLTFITGLAVDGTNENQQIFKRFICAETLQISPELGFDHLLITLRNNFFEFLKTQKKKETLNDTTEFETLVTTYSTLKSDESEKNEQSTSWTDNNSVYETDSKSMSTEVSEPTIRESNQLYSNSCSNSANKKLINKELKSLKRMSKRISSGKANLSQRASELASEEKQEEVRYMNPDRLILSRMTRAQRVLVTQMSASLKNKEINHKGVSKQKIPLLFLLTSVLSKESIKALIKGTIYAKADKKLPKNCNISEPVVYDNLSPAVLSKIRQEISEIETGLKLNNFMMKKSV